eukprot:GHUV01044206.1.p3 GENE.GHUV01044206.1~~GHUV01044206.1.p3  ORF type:complete len:129 (+),score=15.15 GHUV01044206.1:76-462(+)
MHCTQMSMHQGRPFKIVMSMSCFLQVVAAILALALTYVLQLTGSLQWWTRQTVEVENNMTCVERMVEYMNLPQEPPRCAEAGVGQYLYVSICIPVYLEPTFWTYLELDVHECTLYAKTSEGGYVTMWM